ncbi:zinc finger MYM-type protein 1-like [Photinus pyralis]|uniref:zinc finger MYM-type protein 1-like n=1 Tax=Photinus pyralis TaxID=7054 RepID=UPI0012671DD6|nr:zinc finger MYM-type protein 1-like [Photinus pyralis]
MKKVVAFANSSAKRHAVFKDVLGGKSLQSICETRWVERHDGHLQFQGDTLVKICDVLEHIASWRDSKSASDAQCLKYALRSPEFIITTTCLNDVLGTTVSLSRYLQTSSLDLKKATDALKDTMSVLEKKRQEVDPVFQQLFSEAQKIAEQMDVELKIPRTASRQRHRENYPAEIVEEYFRRAVFISLLDSVSSDLKDRLSPDVMGLFNLKVAKRYEGLWGVPASTVVAEFTMWVAKWERMVQDGLKIPDSLIEVIQACDVDLYPCIQMLLKILATLPVSAATAERSFSTLRLLKTWLRSTMEEERLTGLALLHIHRQIQLDVDKIITTFGKSSRRRAEFVI